MQISRFKRISGRRRGAPCASRNGVALVIVLAFVVLLTGLIIAFFSRSIVDRQISNSSMSRAKVNAFADGAADAIIGELKQEIVLSSTLTPTTSGAVTTGTIDLPLTPAAMLPQMSGTAGITWTGTAVPYNLLKLSGSGQPLFYSGTNSGTLVTIPTSGTSNVTTVSTTTPSLNGRYFTPAYWNEHYLLPLSGTATDSTPAQGSFVPPYWVLVARDGSNPAPTTSALASSMTASGINPIVGRYAFAIYHEGGLLDVNAAGHPSTSGTWAARKDSLAYADLTQIGLSGTASDVLVEWRNYASIFGPGQSLPTSFAVPGFTAASGSYYNNFVVSNTTGYLTASGTGYNSQTDRIFGSRQELIKFAQTGLGLSGTSLNVLNYLTTFTRDLNQPSYIPPVQSSATAPVVLPAALGGNSAFGGDQQINPSFPNVRVQSPGFTRYNGTQANVGDPLVNKRFALQRLAWVTPFGPIANDNGNLNTGNAAIGQIITAYENDGISPQFLALGGTTNIANYFGLTWDSTNNRWQYNYELGKPASGGTNNIIMLVGRPAGTAANSKTYVQDASPGREPNFFELLKAGIAVGSLGKATQTSGTSANPPGGYQVSEVPANQRYNFDSSVDYHVIQIGANILSEVNPTSYPVRITFNDGSSRGTWEFQGVTDLPYLSYVFNGVLRTKLPTPGVPSTQADTSPFQYPVATSGTVSVPGNAYVIQVPAVWNPYDPNGNPGVLRPKIFKVLVDSNDPLSLAKGTPADAPVWCAAGASPRTYPIPSGGDNSGIGAPWTPGTVYSFQATGLGLTSTNGVPLSDSVTFNDNNGLLDREPTLIFSANAAGSPQRTGTLGNFNSVDANPLPGETDGATGPWAPLVLGSFPLAFQFANSNFNGTNTTTAPVMYAGTAYFGITQPPGDNRVYFTYRLQYPDPVSNPNGKANGAWITYDTQYGRTADGQCSFQALRSNGSPSVIMGADGGGSNGFNPYSWAAPIDPRTARFGLMMVFGNARRCHSWPEDPPPSNGWVYDSNGNAAIPQGITYSIRPDILAGFQFADLDMNDNLYVWPLNGNHQTQTMANGLLAGSSMTDVPFPSFSAGWTRPIMVQGGWSSGALVPFFAPGMYAQNTPSAPCYVGRYIGSGGDTPSGNPVEPAYYADADGVIRRAAGAYVPSASGSNTSALTPVGLPPGGIQGYSGAPSSLLTPSGTTPFTQSQSRPLLLHRPFRSVAELGYVFRDVPWKNLDFFTPESGDAGLLDLFCVNDTGNPTGLVAGKVNLNTRQAPVVAAIVSAAYVDDPTLMRNPNNAIATVGMLSGSAASTIATALTTRTADITKYGPLQNLSELVGKWSGTAAAATSGTVTYSPSVSTSGTDLPLNSGTNGYKDGSLSYTGFSGAALTSTGAAENLTDAYAAASCFNNAQLQTSMSQVQRFREAPVRALASVGQTRVWNLMIDVVAQTGRYPQSASNLGQFMVDGEQRYWVHVAIDRFTGQVLDKQIEVVKQ